MKIIFKITISFFITSMFLLSCKDKVVEIEKSDFVNIPDSRFKAKLLAYDLDNDNEISIFEAEKIVTLDVSESDPRSSLPKIKDISGIEVFKNLKFFKCYGNQITGKVDFSLNTKLQELNLGFNSISSVNLQNLTNLTELDISGNDLNSLDLTSNINLKKLKISLNKFTVLDITKNIELEEFSSLGNSFTILDFSKNIHLKKLGISGPDHNLTSLDISNCVELKYLAISNIDISKINITNNKSLQYLSLAFLENLKEICVWELPFPDSIQVNFQNCNASFMMCE